MKDEEDEEEEEKGHTSPSMDYKLQPHPIISPYHTRHLPLSIDGVRGKRINMLDHCYQLLSLICPLLDPLLHRH
jgi:hypothetical protein